MTPKKQLSIVKKALSITSDYQDDLLSQLIDEVKKYMIDAGVPVSVVNSQRAIGTICRGVIDLWNLESGNTSLSKYFKERVIQLRMCSEVMDDA